MLLPMLSVWKSNLEGYLLTRSNLRETEPIPTQGVLQMLRDLHRPGTFMTHVGHWASEEIGLCYSAPPRFHVTQK